MDRHAYLLLAHSNFGQLKTLVSLLDDVRTDIYIHVDARAKGFDQRAFDGICKASRLVFIEPRQSVHWGGVSIMRAELALLRAAVSSRVGYSYLHLLSGMDLPIKSQDRIHEFFKENQGKEFINLWQFKKSTFSRFNYYTLFPEGAGMFWTNLANNAFKGLQMLFGFRYNKGIDFHFGSQWFSITENLAKYILDKEDWLEKVFSHTNTCDEVFLPTIVMNSPFRDNLYDPTVYPANTGSRANMRFIDWTRGESVRHPWTFREEDYRLLCEREELWARKFDETVDDGIVKKIANLVK